MLLVDVILAIANGEPAKVCDLGCGNGSLLANLQARGFLAVGIEPSPFARKHAESRGIKVYAETAESLRGPLPESPFDIVVMTHVLEHCLGLQDAISNALQLVRTGGYLVIEVPNCGSFEFQTRGPAWFHFDVGRHLNYFTQRSLEKLINQQAVDIVQHYYREYVDHFIPSTLAIETSLWDQAHEECPGNLVGIRRPSRLENWLSLARSVALTPERKYRCVGIVARKK